MKTCQEKTKKNTRVKYGAISDQSSISTKLGSSIPTPIRLLEWFPLVLGIGIFALLVSHVSHNPSGSNPEVLSTSSRRPSQTFDSLATQEIFEAGVEDVYESDTKFTTLTHADFVQFSTVRNWLEQDLGVDPNTTDMELLGQYVPIRVKVMYRLKAVHGAIGTKAAGGFIAFDLTNMNASTGEYTSSLFVVMDIKGNLKRVLPTFNVGSTTDMHFCGLKLKSPGTFLLAGNSGTTEKGPSYILRWEEEEFENIGNGTYQNCHDIQWAYSGDRFWSPGSHKSIVENYASNGSEAKYLSLSSYAMDINHVGLIENDAVAIVSSRMSDAIIKMNVLKSKVEWIAGGEYGDFDLVTLSGEVKAAGDTLFLGQHNAEYFGDDEYYMFDNQYDQMNSSRMLVVKIDESAGTVTEKWEYTIADYPWGYSPVYGDCDRLPTGNILGSFWPSVQSGRDHKDILFDARIVEVEHDSKIAAMQIDVYGASTCRKAKCDRENFSGWKVYSVERFYTEPLVYSVSCSGDDFRFTTQNIFKQNDEYMGFYELHAEYSMKIYETGNFTFLPHWRAVDVKIDISGLGLSGKNVRLVVKNQFGDLSIQSQECS